MSAKLKHVEFHLLPADNARLASLCGQLDEHLKQIETHLGVRIANRGNSFRVSGSPVHAEHAERVLKELYATTEKNRFLTLAGVQRALHTVDTPDIDQDDDETALRTPKGVVRGRNSHQREYIRNILTHDINFGIGPAGTGKTYLAVASAVDALERDQVKRIVLVR